MSYSDPALTRDAVRKAHERIRPYIHQTPIFQSKTLSTLASTPKPAQNPPAPAAPSQQQQAQDAAYQAQHPGRALQPARPKISLFFKAENLQKTGAFKFRGATHALSHLTTGQLQGGGVVTHSSGNHAAALALAAAMRGCAAHVVMPANSLANKIAATRGYGAEVVFSGPTAPEREKAMQEVRARTGAVFVPPYEHRHIILGQGTVALEFEVQVKALCLAAGGGGVDLDWEEGVAGPGGRLSRWDRRGSVMSEGMDAVIAPLGGGGLLSGIATALQGTGVAVFGAEPEFEGADDGCRGLAADPPERIENVKTMTIADGLRTPVGKIPWSVISDTEKVRGVYSVTEEQIKAAMRLVVERMKILIEPSSAVALAVALYHEGFRRLVEREAGDDGWNVGIVISGGNTTFEAIKELFQDDPAVVNGAGAQDGVDVKDETKVGVEAP